MRTDFQQFYVQPANVQNESFILDGDEFRHAAKVLRKQQGDKISAVDGQGVLYHGKIRELEKDRLVADIFDTAPGVGEPATKVIIALAALKGGHFDLVIEKGVEIGVSAFQAMITDRVIAKRDTKTDRWRKKALTAMKQCGRSRCPDIFPPTDFKSVFINHKADRVFIAHEDVNPESGSHFDFDSKTSSVLVLIGPEGGFTDAEFEYAQQNGAIPLSLGPRRLRAETAAIIAATKVLAAAGELGAYI
jgi:16S rRNA (uracil1498-N3)-methyltransferase